MTPTPPPSSAQSDAEAGIARAVELKKEGNFHFQHGRFKEAMIAYHQIFLHVHGFSSPDALATSLQSPAASCGSSSLLGTAMRLSSQPHELIDLGLPSLPPQLTPPLGRMMTQLMTRLMTKAATCDELAQINDLKLAHHSNLAMCHLRLGALRKARDCCSRALAIDPANVKSLFRRGRCHALMGELDEAKSDLAAVLRIEPTNREASKELHALRARYAEHKAREQRRFAGMFERFKSEETDGVVVPGDASVTAVERVGAELSASHPAVGARSSIENHDAVVADSVAAAAADIHSLLMAEACIDSIDLNELRAMIATRLGASGRGEEIPLGEIASLRDLQAYLREMNIRPSDLFDASQSLSVNSETDSADTNPSSLSSVAASAVQAAVRKHLDRLPEPSTSTFPPRQSQQPPSATVADHLTDRPISKVELARLEAARGTEDSSDETRPPASRPSPPAPPVAPPAAPPKRSSKGNRLQPSAPAAGEGKTLLHVVRKIREASRAGNTEQLRKLLKSGGDVNMREADSDSPALYLASLKGHASCMQLLLANGAEVDALTKEGLCSLYASCQSGKAECVELLLAANAKVDLPNKKGSTPLYMACLNGHVDCARLMLGAKAAVDRLNSDGFTPLYAACETGKHECVDLLLQSDATTDLAATDGRTSLFAACKYGKVSCVRLLLAAGADVDLPMEDGTTPLCVAAASGSTECVRALLGASATVDLANDMGSTALHEAARGGYEASISLLIGANAPVDALNDDGASPLYFACEAGRGSCVDLLLRANASVAGGMFACFERSSVAEEEEDETMPREDSSRTEPLLCNSPLFAACAVGSVECVALLVAARAAVNEASSEGATPLFAAAQHGHTECAALVIDAHASVDLTNAQGVSPLYAASYAGKCECVRLLLRLNADVDGTTLEGQTALHACSSADHPACISLLLAQQADVNKRSLTGCTPLYAACVEGSRDSARLLIAASATVDIASYEGYTPLYGACEQGRSECVELLLRQHARTDAATRTGYTALMIAGSNGHPECMRLLLNAGADMRAKGNKGETILTLVKANTVGHQQCVRMLEAEAAAALLLMEEAVEAGVKKGGSKKKKKKTKAGSSALGVTDPPSPAPLHGWGQEQESDGDASLSVRSFSRFDDNGSRGGDDDSSEAAGRTDTNRSKVDLGIENGKGLSKGAKAVAKAATRETKESGKAAVKSASKDGAKSRSKESEKGAARESSKDVKDGRRGLEERRSASPELKPSGPTMSAWEEGVGGGSEEEESTKLPRGDGVTTSKRQQRQELRRQAKAAEEARHAARENEAREAAVHAAAMKALHRISSATSPSTLRAAVDAVTAECAAALPALAAALSKAREMLGDESPPASPTHPPATGRPVAATDGEEGAEAGLNGHIGAAKTPRGGGQAEASDSDSSGARASAELARAAMGRVSPHTDAQRPGAPSFAAAGVGAPAALPPVQPLGEAVHAPSSTSSAIGWDPAFGGAGRDSGSLAHLISPTSSVAGIENGLQFKVTRRAVGLIIGTAGERVKTLRQKTRADIHISKEEDGTGTVILSGTKESVQQARLAIIQLLDAEPTGSLGARRETKADHQAIGQIQSELVGRLIGAKGGVIQRIRQDSGAQIGLSKGASGLALVVVEGISDAVQAAKISIEQSIGVDIEWEDTIPSASTQPAAIEPPSSAPDRFGQPYHTSGRAWGPVDSHKPPPSAISVALPTAIGCTPSTTAIGPPASARQPEAGTADRLGYAAPKAAWIDSSPRGSCPVCGEALKDARVFECGHTVCGECTAAHWGRCAICSTTQHTQQEDSWMSLQGLPPPSTRAVPASSALAQADSDPSDQAAIGSALFAALDECHVDELAAPEFFCPITHELMQDPVCTLDGQTFERHAIEFWLRDHDTSPLTGKRLGSKMLIPNFIVRSQIRRLLEGKPPAQNEMVGPRSGVVSGSTLVSATDPVAPMLGPERLGPGLLTNGAIGNGGGVGTVGNAFSQSEAWGISEVGHSPLHTTGRSVGNGGRGPGPWMAHGLNPWNVE